MKQSSALDKYLEGIANVCTLKVLRTYGIPVCGSTDKRSLFSLALSKCHTGYVSFDKTGPIRFPVLEDSSLYFCYPH
jgi:hypothetical protein